MNDEQYKMTKRNRISMIAFEAIAIFCSVLLAFAADQWREDANEKSKAIAVLGLVKAELAANLVELESTVGVRDPMLREYLVALNALEESDRFPAELEHPPLPDVTNIAYRIAADSGVIADIDPAELLLIARAYEAIQEVGSNEVFLDNRNAQIRYRDGEQYLSGFIYYSNRAIASEPDAIQSIKDALEVM